MNPIATQRLSPEVRVRQGVERERQIANALRDQVGLPIADASGDDDKTHKVDRWLVYPGQRRIALQIKYRETGSDLLFEVYDRWQDWDHPSNKLGRDMQGDAQEYAVLLPDHQTVVMVPTQLAKATIQQMISFARLHGWTVSNFASSTLRFFEHGLKLELKAQRDPRDGRQKMVAYIPADYFVAAAQAKVYQVLLPKKWK